MKFFKTENEALEYMRIRNRAAKAAGNKRDLMVVTDGPDDNFAAMDAKEAIENDFNYKWEV